jgi:hypothetical protein
MSRLVLQVHVRALGPLKGSTIQFHTCSKLHNAHPVISGSVDMPMLMLQHPPRPARARLMRPFVGAGVHHAAFVGEPQAWASSNVPLVRAALLHLWLRCMCRSADLDQGQITDLEIRGFLFVEPRNTQHINSPAAPLLQVGQHSSMVQCAHAMVSERASWQREGRHAPCTSCLSKPTLTLLPPIHTHTPHDPAPRHAVRFIVWNNTNPAHATA